MPTEESIINPPRLPRTNCWLPLMTKKEQPGSSRKAISDFKNQSLENLYFFHSHGFQKPCSFDSPALQLVLTSWKAELQLQSLMAGGLVALGGSSLGVSKE